MKLHNVIKGISYINKDKHVTYDILFNIIFFISIYHTFFIDCYIV